MSERIIAVVPVRSLRNGKTRLAPVLDPETRHALLRQMANRVVTAAVASGAVEQTLVISPDLETLHWASGLPPSVIALPQPADLPGLNGAIEAGRQWALDHGASAVLSLFADLPLLTARDLRRLAARSDPVVLGPDRRDEGTNALLLRLAPPGDAFRFAFGAGSLARHRAEARRLGLEVAVHSAPGIAFDLDTPDDWADYLAASSESEADPVLATAPCGACAG